MNPTTTNTAPAGQQADPETSCVNAWCNRTRDTKGYCAACYMRAWRSGDPARATTVHNPWDVSRNDIDTTAVQRIVDGDPPEHTTLGEREAAVRQLHSYGLDDHQIAARTGYSVSLAWRTRTRLGLPANRRGGWRRGQVYISRHDRMAPTTSIHLLPHPWLTGT